MEVNNPIDMQDINLRMKFLNRERLFSGCSGSNLNEVMGETLGVGYDRSIDDEKVYKRLKS